MGSIDTIKYKRPVKYDIIPLKPPHLKGGYHMFTGLKNQLELSDMSNWWYFTAKQWTNQIKKSLKLEINK